MGIGCVISGGWDKMVKLWDPRSPNPLLVRTLCWLKDVLCSARRLTIWMSFLLFSLLGIF